MDRNVLDCKFPVTNKIAGTDCELCNNVGFCPRRSSAHITVGELEFLRKENEKLKRENRSMDMELEEIDRHNGMR